MKRDPLDRMLLRDGVAQAVLELLVTGALPAGSRIKDSVLAEQLGTSRLPVREALIDLARRGFVRTLPGRGFRVPEFERQEILDVYPLVIALECLALESSARATPSQMRVLAKTARSMDGASKDALKWLKLDRQWHETLLEGCSNARLMSMVDDLRQQIQRYELIYMTREQGIRHSLREHRAIAEEHGAGRKRSASKLLRAHWERGMSELLERIE
jgi:DNA-binding GntR family transcriptional regulator